MSTADRLTAALVVVSPSTQNLPLYRMHLLRVGYSCTIAGNALTICPDNVGRDAAWIEQSVSDSLLTAVSLVALLGLRYPTRMLPVLLIDSTWKVLWLARAALPAALMGGLTPAMQEVLVTCASVVAVVAVTPWTFTRHQYWTTKGDPWR